ncbi:MAG: ferritin family protein [Desulfobacterota bacterium]|nr:ferritin family protein [Thermodesulfobacteriota bacterium]
MQGILKSLDIALENELQERNFYEMHSRRTRNPVGRAMFEHIARDEDEHYRRLQDLHAQMTRTGAWPENLSITVQSVNIVEALLNAANASKESVSADADDRVAVATAIEFETKGYSFYKSLAEAAHSPAEKNFFTQLASM